MILISATINSTIIFDQVKRMDILLEIDLN